MTSIERPPGPKVMASLSRDRRKADLFIDDSFFREGWADLSSLQCQPVAAFVRPLALALFKPEALAGNKVGPALDWLAERGFFPVAFDVVPFAGPTIHALWRYQIRRNTIDKIRLYTRWIAQVPAMVVAFRRAGLHDAPASVELSALKGPALVARRSGNDLRTFLGSPNSILNFLHSADEPADIVREIAILVPAARRRAFIAALGANPEDPSVAQAARTAAKPIIPRLVDPAAAGKAIAERLRRVATPEASAAVAKIEKVLAGGVAFDLYAFEIACLESVNDIDPVDMFVFGSEFIERDIVGVTGDLEDRASPL